MKSHFLVLLLLVIPAKGSTQQAPAAPLRGARSLKCSFPETASLNWKSSDAKPELRQQEFSFVIDGIDHKAHKARLIGNLAAVDLDIIDGANAVTFLEVTPSGNVNITSVFADRAAGPRTFKAVHSRHIFTIGGPLPSQAYGSCEIWD